MSRSISFPYITIFLTLAFLPSLWADEKPPNVVILLADDLGWSDLGCYDGPVRTPILDQLARDGTRFTDFYSGAAVCSPSRAVLMTGRTNLRSGIYSWINDHAQQMHLPLREETLAEVLKHNGYATGHFGKWHLGMPTTQFPDKPTPDAHGFDYWLATGNNAQPSHRNPVNFDLNGQPLGKVEGYSCDIVVEHAIQWLDSQRSEAAPFFLNVWFHEPHAPLAAPADLVEHYGGQDDPAAVYSATIENTDRAIGRLIRYLHKIDKPENTLIVYASDNGSYRSDRVGHLRGTKGSNYEGGIRVPGLFCWPGHIPAGRTTSEPAGLVDVLPTICGLTASKSPDVKLDGFDLSEFLLEQDTAISREQPLLWGLPLSGPAFAIREGRYGMVAYREGQPPRDQEAIAAIKKELEELLREKGIYEEETRGSTFARQLFEGFDDREAERMRGKFIRLNQFSESWIPAIKQSNLVRFELYDLVDDPSQKVELSTRSPQIHYRMKKQLQELATEILSEAWDWSSGTSPTAALKRVHRLDSPHRSAFDAFVYVNRIPLEPEAGESQVGLAGRILGRLANQEGRVLVKLPPGMNQAAYTGFKIAVGSQSEQEGCTTCHSLPAFGHTGSSAVPTLRNQSYSLDDYRSILNNTPHQTLDLDAKAIHQLHALQETLVDVSDTEFRELIINTTVIDTGEEP